MRLFEPSVFYNHRTTKWPHHHCNNKRHHAIFLFVVVSKTNQGHMPKRKVSSLMTLSHISCVLRWSGMSSSCHGSTSTALKHISCLKMIRDKSQYPWVVAHDLIEHFLGPTWNICISHIYLYLWAQTRVKIYPETVIFESGNFLKNQLPDTLNQHFFINVFTTYLQLHGCVKLLLNQCFFNFLYAWDVSHSNWR